MQSQFLIWQRTPGPRVTINFTFNCQQVLITGITAALNVRFLLIFLPVKKVNRPKEINIARPPSTEISFGVHNLIFITCKYGAEVKKGKRMSLSFNECWHSQWNSFFFFFFFSLGDELPLPQMYNRSFSKSLQPSCYLLSCEAPLLELTKPTNGASEACKWQVASTEQPLWAKWVFNIHLVLFPCEIKKKQARYYRNKYYYYYYIYIYNY